MKKLALAVVVFAIFAMIASSAMARKVRTTQDMVGSKQNVVKTCEGKGVKMIGITYNDTQHADCMDAVSVICKGRKGEFEVPNSDFNDRSKVRIKCNPYEKVIGVVYKDRAGKDAADGASVICKDIKHGEERIAYNKDLQGGRQYVETKIMSPRKKVIGIVYNDRVNGDCVDGVGIVEK